MSQGSGAGGGAGGEAGEQQPSGASYPVLPGLPGARSGRPLGLLLDPAGPLGSPRRVHHEGLLAPCGSLAAAEDAARCRTTQRAPFRVAVKARQENAARNQTRGS